MNVSADASFGPQLEGQFDFTLLFEQSIFSIGPSALFLVVAPVRVAVLASRKPGAWKTARSKRLWSKLACLTVLFILQVVVLVLWSLPATPHTEISVAAASLSLVEILAMGCLVWAEHRYSPSPSMTLSIYLSVTILLDLSIVRSLFLRSDLVALGGITAGTLALKLFILALEEVPKKNSTGSKVSEEVSSGLWSRSVFWWLLTTFRKGFNSFLGIDDLSTLAGDSQLHSPSLISRLGHKWQLADKSARYCLACAAFRAFQSIFWAGVIPRLCFTGFSFAQPFLINTIVNSLGASTHQDSHQVAGGLVGATALIYVGIALSKCHYTHCANRLIVAVRGGLVALIFDKAIALDASTAKDSAAVTLMSTDIDGIASALQKIHDIWASFIELGLAIFLLERQIGSACFLILIPAMVSSFATGRVARGMGPARMEWNSKV
ncbi:hypothetical protein N0V93_000795 [Gnomoniopsis smithogilvyi]|uniref:ABC transmembrane type-1 domain-containing protein n=1 Tax=Gnomoniopsis smithogilvyi TaxID=1191159 RepID=A0A9W9D1N9_9PEZI|nr:hypothetical protein N0V93_000795 [Gnomoniopsis smithogilvyi]